MKLKTLAMISLALVAVMPAMAEEYRIRANRGLNLRADGSLQSRVVDTVPSGTILHVTGSFNHWLKIDHNDRTVWLANWTDHSRVGETTQPASAPVDNCCSIDSQCSSDYESADGFWFQFQHEQCPASPQPAISLPAKQPVQPAQPATQPAQPASAPVDNCCFVDRQCSADSEWTEGYWAFRRNECPAPAQPPTGSPADVDNCCFLGWQCHSNYDWIVGYESYQKNQCEHGSPQEVADSSLDAKVSAALNLMKARAPHWYQYVINASLTIRAVPENRIYVISRTGVTSFGADTWLVKEGPIEAVAATLAHEACHVHRWRKGKVPGGLVGETACTRIEIQTMKDIGAPGWLIANEEHLLANISNPAYQWWHD